MARTRPLPRKLSAPRFGRGKTIHPCSFPRCSLTVEFIISRLYIYMYTNVTNRSNEFLTNTNIQRKYSVIFQWKFYRGWKFAWPSLLLIDRDEFSMLFYLWTGTENDHCTGQLQNTLLSSSYDWRRVAVERRFLEDKWRCFNGLIFQLKRALEGG